MNFKSPNQRAEFWQLHPKLRLILCDIDNWLQYQFNEEIIVTDLIRSEEQQKQLYDAGMAPAVTSVHQFGRGADLRVFKSLDANHTVLQWVNEKYPYDLDREHLKTMIRHGGTALHYHLQCLT